MTDTARFNWAARKLHKRLEQLGAKEVYPRGEGDEQHEEGLVALVALRYLKRLHYANGSKVLTGPFYRGLQIYGGIYYLVTPSRLANQRFQRMFFCPLLILLPFERPLLRP